jgi:hypothetical protein
MSNALKFRIPNLDNKIRTATAKQARTLIEKNQPPGPEPGRANKLTKAQFVPAKKMRCVRLGWSSNSIPHQESASEHTARHSG